MDTKLKSTKKPSAKVSFWGMLSWLSMLLLIYVFIAGFGGLAAAAYNPQEFVTFTAMMYSMFNDSQNIPYWVIVQLVSLIGLLALTIALTVIFRKQRKSFEASLAELMSHIWVEAKLASLCICIVAATNIGNIWFVILVGLVAVYLLCLDLGYNRNILSKNIINTLLQNITTKGRRSSYEALSNRRLYSVIFVILGIIGLVVLLMSVLTYMYNSTDLRYRVYIFFNIVTVVSGLAGIVGSVFWYNITQKKDLHDLSLIMRQVEKMYAGNLDAVNHVPPTSNFYDFAMQLNMIRTGIQKAVDEGLKADKTKVELITNVSHDIKTPLTSIITYVELLKMEPDLSDTTKDYIETISNKANRLSHLVLDVFEISKATTGNLNLSLEILDIKKLIEQTMAELDEAMTSAPISWRVDLPDIPVQVNADGQKLYRVFQNLIKNCTQYSLEGSRAYISLTTTDSTADVVIRNISKNELEPAAAEYLTGRFIRGDQTRSSEGSGLGLSIAKSFTEACGGSFTLRTDGDIFYTLVQFPLANKAVPSIAAPAKSIQENYRYAGIDSSAPNIENMNQTADKKNAIETDKNGINFVADKPDPFDEQHIRSAKPKLGFLKWPPKTRKDKKSR